MKSSSLLEVMVKDHTRLLKYLQDVKNNLTHDQKELSKLFTIFQWNLEKHFFVEERAIFTWYNPEKIDDGYQLFSDLSKQHTLILEKVESLQKSVQSCKSKDISDLETMLLTHKNFEEKHVYPILDEQINKSEKQFMIERINDVL
jgi:iron-sulfur cluster repair protein YtfE (RIC family)